MPGNGGHLFALFVCQCVIYAHTPTGTCADDPVALVDVVAIRHGNRMVRPKRLGLDTRMNRPCLDCGTVGPWSTPHGLRCPTCYKRWGGTKRRTHRYPHPPTGRCATCGGREGLTWDHVVPVSRGGTNERRNLQILCRSCNSRKGHR